jgi:DNA-binding response OmpR family regulator
MKILLIEDNREIRENIAEILELDGFDVITAQNGKEGLDSAQREIPDLIICDIMMPIMDGYTVLYFLAKDPKTVDIPFIFLTAKAERMDFRKGMEMGADDYITKPFEDVELINAIRSRLKKKEMTRKDYSQGISGLEQIVSDSEGEEALQKLIENREIRDFKKKSEIYREGDYPLYLYYLQSGKAKSYKTNDNGKELILNLYNEGDFMGYTDLIQDSNFSDSLETIEDSKVILIPKKIFSDLLLKNASVARKFIQLISKDVQHTYDDLLKLAYNSVRKRVSEALLLFFKDLSESIKVSREDLAAKAGTSLETAIRTLSDFKDEKLIDISSGKITILEAEKLKNLRN